VDRKVKDIIKQLFFIVGFLLTIIFSHVIEDYVSRDEYTIKKVEESLIDITEKQDGLVNSYLLKLESGSTLDEVADLENFSIRIFDNGTLIYWNNNQKVPTYSRLKQKDTTYLVVDQSIFLITKGSVRKESNRLTEVFVITELRSSYAIQNEYLRDQWNRAVFGDLQFNVVESGAPIDIRGYTVLRISPSISSHNYEQNSLARIAIFTIGLVLLFLVFNERRSTSMLAVITCLILVRLLQLRYFPDFQLYYVRYSDKLLYYDSWWLPSMADLAINVLMYYLFIQQLNYTKHIRRFYGWVICQSTLIRELSVLISILVAALNFKLYFDLLWSLQDSSEINFDISVSLGVHQDLIFAFLLILLHTVAFFILNHSLFVLVKHLVKSYKKTFLYLVLGFGILYFSIPEHIVVPFIVFALTWSILILTKTGISSNLIRFRSLSYFLVVAFGISLLFAFTNFAKYQKSIKLEKDKFASGLIIGNDILGEFYMDQLANEIKADPFIRSRFLNQVLAQQNIKLRIASMIPYYLDKYQIQIHTYDAAGAPYGSTELTDLDYWKHSYAIPDNGTGYEGLYFSKVNGIRNKYIALVPLSFFDDQLGYIVLELSQRKYYAASVFPSLLIEKSPFQSEIDFSYGVYQGQKLSYSEGSVFFEKELPIVANLNTVNYPKEGNHYTRYQMGEQAHLVVASAGYQWLNVFANVAFFFLCCLVLISIAFAASRGFNRNGSLSLSNKIQFFIGLSFIAPMLLITGSLLQVLNNSYMEEIEKNYQKRAKNIGEQFVVPVSDFMANEINRDQFFNQIRSAADLTQTDLLIYSKAGVLMGTNRPEVISLNLLSNRINPSALDYFEKEQGQVIILNEKIGSLDFKTVYTGIYNSDSGVITAIISVPFFDFKNHLERQKVEVFESLIILITIVFLLTIYFSQVNLKRLISPIKTIAKRLKTINYLNEGSQVLEYRSRDEIGALVGEFNTMVSKLEESKKELEQIQKENAWKEIAKQVAHEIKNPITPMRLKIQQLQHRFKEDAKAESTLSSLLSQVDALASIADSFSAFAKMPAPKSSRFNLSKILEQSVAFFQSENVTISTQVIEQVYVWADQEMVIKVLNNLILNAIQADPAELKEISVQLELAQNKAKLCISDKGIGISEQNRDQIFKPYFSTKETGSGIGLALAKKGIEQAKGSIWFESEEGKGTTFYLSLPLS
jgi:signal transduction histidine kinase